MYKMNEIFTPADNAIYQLCKKALEVIKDPSLYNEVYIDALICELSGRIDLTEPAYLAIFVNLMAVITK